MYRAALAIGLARAGGTVPAWGRSRVGVPASAGSQQGPSGPRSPFLLKKRGHGKGAEAPEQLPPEGGTPAVAASRNIDL